MQIFTFTIPFLSVLPLYSLFIFPLDFGIYSCRRKFLSFQIQAKTLGQVATPVKSSPWPKVVVLFLVFDVARLTCQLKVRTGCSSCFYFLLFIILFFFYFVGATRKSLDVIVSRFLSPFLLYFPHLLVRVLLRFPVYFLVFSIFAKKRFLGILHATDEHKIYKFLISQNFNPMRGSCRPKEEEIWSSLMSLYEILVCQGAQEIRTVKSEKQDFKICF